MLLHWATGAVNGGRRGRHRRPPPRSPAWTSWRPGPATRSSTRRLGPGQAEKDAITSVTGQAWQIAVGPHGEVRERRAEDACTDTSCAHRTCWVEGAHVSELTARLSAATLRATPTGLICTPCGHGVPPVEGRKYSAVWIPG